MESKWFGCAVVGVLVLVAVVPVGLGQGPRTAQIASIVEVVFETLAAGGVTPGPTQVLAIRELETLDENVKEALVGLFQAFAVFERQSGTSFGRGTGATDLNDFLDARAALAKATDGFLGALGPAPASHSAAPLVADVHAQLKILPHPKLTTDGGVAASLGTDDANHTDFSTSFEATVNSGDPALWTARQDTNACVKFSIDRKSVV